MLLHCKEDEDLLNKGYTSYMQNHLKTQLPSGPFFIHGITNDL